MTGIETRCAKCYRIILRSDANRARRIVLCNECLDPPRIGERNRCMKVYRKEILHENSAFIYFARKGKLFRGRISPSKGHHNLFARDIREFVYLSRKCSRGTREALAGLLAAKNTR